MIVSDPLPDTSNAKYALAHERQQTCVPKLLAGDQSCFKITAHVSHCKRNQRRVEQTKHCPQTITMLAWMPTCTWAGADEAWTGRECTSVNRLLAEEDMHSLVWNSTLLAETPLTAEVLHQEVWKKESLRGGVEDSGWKITDVHACSCLESLTVQPSSALLLDRHAFVENCRARVQSVRLMLSVICRLVDLQGNGTMVQRSAEPCEMRKRSGLTHG